MADKKAKQQAYWCGHPIVAPEHEHSLNLAAAIHEFQGGMPRDEAEKQALLEYRQEHHARAAAHHYAGMKASSAIGNSEDAEKHHALYSLHVKALGEDPFGPVPAAVRKFHGAAGQEKRHVYGFKGHDADNFLVQSMQKGELSIEGLATLSKAESYLADLVKADDPRQEQLDLGGPKQNVLRFPGMAEAPPEVKCVRCGSTDAYPSDLRPAAGTHRCNGCGEYFEPGRAVVEAVKGGAQATSPVTGHLKVVKAELTELGERLQVLKAREDAVRLARTVLDDLQKK